MRDYDPTLGRYIQADPLGLVDGASVFNYALQNPERYADPRGEAVCGGACVAGLVIVTGILIDYLLDEGCYTMDDFLLSLLNNINPAKKVNAVANMAKRAKGAAKNDRKHRNRDQIDDKIKDAKKRRDEIKQTPNKTPETNKALERVEREIKRLEEKRRASPPDAINPERRG